MKKAGIFKKRQLKVVHIAVILVLLLSGTACHKTETKKESDFQMIVNKLIFYPEKHVSINFAIAPKDETEPYTVKWYSPDSLNGTGPHTLRFSENTLVDFEVLIPGIATKRFSWQLLFDTIDSVRYDYRNNYTGRYLCEVKSVSNGTTLTYPDTLNVLKNSVFPRVNIQNRTDIQQQWEGNVMIYQNANGFNNSPDGEFFGYHSGVTFRNDSMFYSISGPLGNYYTLDYRGVKMKDN